MSPWRISRRRPCTGSPIAPPRPWPRRGPGPSGPRSAGPSSASSSMSRTDASISSAAAPWAWAWVASRSPTSATGRGSGIVSTSTSPGCTSAIAACTIRLSSWPQRTVRAGPATREPGTTWIRSSVDVAAAAAGLVDGGRAERGQLADDASLIGAHHLGSDPLEGLGLADVLVARGAPGVVAAMVGALGVVGLEVLLGLHLRHRGALGVHRRVMSTNVVGVKLHSSGWWGSNRKNSGGDGRERALHAGAGGEAAGAADGGVGDRVVGVEGVGVGVGDEHVGGELADLVGDALAAPRRRSRAGSRRGPGSGSRRRDAPAARSASPWRIFLTLSIVWPVLLPQLAGLALLAVGERDHARRAAGRGGHRERAARAPHEVGRVGADDQHPPRAALTTGRLPPPGACWPLPSRGPPRRRTRPPAGGPP